MYLAFYNLKEQPFRLTPDPGFIYMTAHHREALAGLVYTVCTRPGLTVLTGEAGTGKTTLLYALVDLLEKRRVITAMCTNPTLTREEFYDLLMLKFGIQCASTMKSRQLASLQETLLRNRTEGHPAILIIDEAHRLTPELLEEIRLLLNIETPREKLLQIVISGQPELSDILHRPDLRQFKQRVSCFCKLNPLTTGEIKEYIDHRLGKAGILGQTIFPDAVIPKISEYTGGIPRLVNTLCDSSLQIGFAVRSASVDAAILDEAARDLDLVRSAALDEYLSQDPVRDPVPVTPPGDRPAVVEKNGHGAPDDRIPLENYASRQKSISFFAQLMDRWR